MRHEEPVVSRSRGEYTTAVYLLVGWSLGKVDIRQCMQPTTTTTCLPACLCLTFSALMRSSAPNALSQKPARA